ncbi:hypothetical protein V2J09_023524 [Rumex salicifolius]
MSPHLFLPLFKLLLFILPLLTLLLDFLARFKHIISLMGSFPDKTSRSSDVYANLGMDELPEEATPASTPQVVSILATNLEKSIKKNEKLVKSSKKRNSLRITAFHGIKPPSLSVVQYLERISKYARCSPSCFVIAFIYIERYIQHKGCLITSFNVHRLLITAVMMAAKFIDDVSFNNAYFGKVGGLSTAEMNKLEMELLFSLDFRLHVKLETFDQYCLQLEKESSAKIERPTLIIQVCGCRGRWCDKDEPKKYTSKIAGYNL